ncbi:hypothetical protein L1049_018289 [Liquidambar formosana]|uniref:Ribosomal protein L34e superfamily protein n=1 Tax=Liquidambar formosana TaxID=63359 RepID=A0AAP0R9V5_LIQFO
MVDCRSLIEFCKEFEQHRNLSNSLGVSDPRTNNHCHSRGKKHNPFCEHCPPFAAIDLVLLLLVLGAVAVLILPYFSFILHEASEVFPAIRDLIRDAIRNGHAVYVVIGAVGSAMVIALWEILNAKSRKCGNPFCKGLRKAVEFDIQLESEQCVKYMPPLPSTLAYGAKPLELGDDHKELEAELKKMAPPNGRTVLIFRAPCGCPLGRMEVWGPKKVRRIKK